MSELHYGDEYRDGCQPLTGLLAGLAGGLVASWVMNQFQAGLSKASEALSEDEGQQEGQQHEQQGSEESEDATMKAADKVAEVTLGRHLDKEEKKKGGPLVHYVFGAAMGGLYGLLSEYVPKTRVGFGTVFGTALWLVADEIAVPALGLSEPPNKVPVSSHGYALASHLVYGLSTEAVRWGIRKAA